MPLPSIAAILNRARGLLPRAARTDRRMLFICGAPRSGTTGLWRLLVGDPRIVLGMERHGARLRKTEFRAELYEKKHFFDFDTHPNAARLALPYYENEAAQRFDSAVYIGDKMPLLFKVYARVSSIFPEAKTVVLLRNIFDICESYQARLEDHADNWKFGVTDAVGHWNSLLAFLSKHGSDPRVKVLVYEEFLSDIAVYRDLYRFLDLPMDSGFPSRYETMLEETERLRRRRIPRTTEAQKLLVLRSADLALYAGLLRRFSITQRTAPAVSP
jgi:hypothetical protein